MPPQSDGDLNTKVSNTNPIGRAQHLIDDAAPNVDTAFVNIKRSFTSQGYDGGDACNALLQFQKEAQAKLESLTNKEHLTQEQAVETLAKDFLKPLETKLGKDFLEVLAVAGLRMGEECKAIKLAPLPACNFFTSYLPSEITAPTKDDPNHLSELKELKEKLARELADDVAPPTTNSKTPHSSDTNDTTTVNTKSVPNKDKTNQSNDTTAPI